MADKVRSKLKGWDVRNISTEGQSDIGTDDAIGCTSLLAFLLPFAEECG